MGGIFGSGLGGVITIDGISGAVTLVAGSNITITDNSPSAGNIEIAATGGSPGGSNTDIQYNNSGAFGGSSNFTFTSSNSSVVLNSGATSGAALTLNCNSISGGQGLLIVNTGGGGGDCLLVQQTNSSYNGDTVTLNNAGLGRALYVQSNGGNNPALQIDNAGTNGVDSLLISDGTSGNLINAGNFLAQGDSNNYPGGGNTLVGAQWNPYGDWLNAGYTPTGYGDLLLSGQLQIGCNQVVGGENFPRYSGTVYDTTSAIMSAGDICIFSQAFANFGGKGNVFMGDNFHSFTGIAGGGLWISSYPGNSDPVTMGWDVLEQIGSSKAAIICNYNSGTPQIVLNGRLYSNNATTYGWTFGGYSASIPVATGYVEISINGTNYFLSASTSA